MKRHRIIQKYGNGGTVEPLAGLASTLPGILDTIIGLTENNSYSKQPIVNASTVRGMATPYTRGSFAFGGQVDEEYDEKSLQAIADEYDIDIEEVRAMLEAQKNPDSMDEDNYSGGYEEPDEEEELMPDKDEEEEEETFAYGGRTRGMYALGGKVPIEIEGGEVMETPQGQLIKAPNNAPSHEEGGINTSVPAGTKIFSDRIQIDGKTMQERKLIREKAVARIEKLKAKNPQDALLKSSHKRTMEINQLEEEQDMQLQAAIKQMQEGQPMTRAKFRNGTDANGVPIPGRKPIKGAYQALLNNFGTSEDFNTSPLNLNLPEVKLFDTPNTLELPEGAESNTHPLSFKNIEPLNPDKLPENLSSIESPDENNLSTGDYIGLAGNAFNAIAPLISSRNAAAATKPTRNRFRGFGREAIMDNDAQQSMLETIKNEDLTDISTANNSAKERNRNSVSSVNTLNALNAVTDMASDRARTSSRNSFTKGMLTLRGQRGQLTNMKDNMEMSAQERVDNVDEAKMDNIFTNNAANLVNLGNNIQGIGRNLNTSRQNRVDTNLVNSMVKNNLEVDANTGKVKNKFMLPKDVQTKLDLGYTVVDGKLVRPRKRK